MNPILTAAMKKTITDLRLIDTGALLASAEVFVNTTGNRLILDVRSEDYIKYHIYSRQITKTFTNQPGVNPEINRILIPVIEKSVEKAITQGTPYEKPEIYITYNDRRL